MKKVQLSEDDTDRYLFANKKCFVSCSLQKTCRPQLAFGIVSGRPPLPNLRGPLPPRPQACKGKASRTESLTPSFARSGFKVRAWFRDRNEGRFGVHFKGRFSVSPL